MTDISLSWTASVAGTNPIAEYSLERAIDGVAYTVLATIAHPTLVYLDEDVEGEDIQYRVRPRDDEGNYGAYSNVVAFEIEQPSVPEAPVLSGESTTDLFGAQLSWTVPASSPAITGYILEFSFEDEGTWEAFSPIDSDVLEYLDDEVSAGQTWSYRVAAVNSVGQGPYSNVVEVTIAEVIETGFYAAYLEQSSSIIKADFSTPSVWSEFTCALDEVTAMVRKMNTGLGRYQLIAGGRMIDGTILISVSNSGETGEWTNAPESPWAGGFLSGISVNSANGELYAWGADDTDAPTLAFTTDLAQTAWTVCDLSTVNGEVADLVAFSDAGVTQLFLVTWDGTAYHSPDSGTTFVEVINYGGPLADNVSVGLVGNGGSPGVGVAISWCDANMHSGTDGDPMTARTNPFTPSNYRALIPFSQVVAAGHDGSAAVIRTALYTNLNSWTTRTPPDSTKYIGCGQGGSVNEVFTYVLMGVNEEGDTPFMWTSIDSGATWTEVTETIPVTGFPRGICIIPAPT